MVSIEYADMYEYQIMFKVLLYSIKLKCEFFILNMITKAIRSNSLSGRELDSQASQVPQSIDLVSCSDQGQNSSRSPYDTRCNYKTIEK
ncbi:hypothetical protein HK099_007350 [Clydaea vesicula]|uniref:DUF7703 domain-containing protein n=1 Tax=Clydaea vesicula TaxID=447962 RepID=A0AAD5TXC2_9FUNG|nr:hypothetical protein HK099_007350 [Clydaea vesicula]